MHCYDSTTKLFSKVDIFLANSVNQNMSFKVLYTPVKSGRAAIPVHMAILYTSLYRFINTDRFPNLINGRITNSGLELVDASANSELESADSRTNSNIDRHR